MKALIVANWKMNPQSLKEAKKLLEVTKKAIAGTRTVSVIIAPPSLYLQPLIASTKSKQINFAAQNTHFEKEGAHTGEISLGQVKDVKAQYVLVGHAERRAQGETNEDVRKKVAGALAHSLTPILCIGEKERNSAGDHFVVIREQLHVGLKDVLTQKLSKLLIAYEPVWAIGASRAMSPNDMHEMSIFIRKSLVERFGEQGHTVPILYGGAVDATTAAPMLRDGDVKGLLVGRASTQLTGLVELIRAVARA